MEIKEAHILFDTLQHQINSNRKGTIAPSQKDLLINIAQISFTNTRISALNSKREGFDDTQKRLDDLKDLKRSASLTPIVALDEYGNNKAVYARLPWDYMHRTNDRSLLKYDCTGQTFTQISSTVNRASVSFLKDITSTTNFYSTFRIVLTTSVGTTTMFDLASLPVSYFATNVQNMKTEEARFYIINLVLDYFNREDTTFTTANGGTISLNVYWENYGEFNYKNKFIFEVRSYTGGGVETLTNVVVTSLLAGPIASTGSFTTPLTEKIYNYSVATGTANEVVNRMTGSDEVYTQLSNPFGKTVHHAPLSTMRRGTIRVFHDDKFVLSSINIEYLKKPRLVNIHHRINLDFEDINICHEIILQAAKLTDAVLNSPSYDKMVKEYLTIE